MMKSSKVNVQTIRKMERLLSVCSDQTRLKIMLCLLNERECSCCCSELSCCSKCRTLSCMIEKNVSEIMQATGCSQSLVSHQLKVMRDEDIVKTRKSGLKVYYSLKDGHIKELLDIVKEHVEER